MRERAWVVVVVLSLGIGGCALFPQVDARFAMSPVSGYPPLAVAFDASASSSSGGGIRSYLWEFGDGTSGDGPATEHVYAEKGIYTVTLTVVDTAGNRASVQRTVEALNRIPHARFTAQPYQPPRDYPVRFDASGSDDEDGEIVSYSWDFGDGTSAEGPVVEHVFPAQRVKYTVVLTVTDDDGAFSATSRIVEPVGCDTCG